MIDKLPIERLSVKGSSFCRSMGWKSRAREVVLTCFNDIYNICRDSIQSKDDFAEYRRILAVCTRIRAACRNSSFYRNDKIAIGNFVRSIEKLCIGHLQTTLNIKSLTELDRPFRSFSGYSPVDRGS